MGGRGDVSVWVRVYFVYNSLSVPPLIQLLHVIEVKITVVVI